MIVANSEYNYMSFQFFYGRVLNYEMAHTFFKGIKVLFTSISYN